MLLTCRKAAFYTMIVLNVFFCLWMCLLWKLRTDTSGLQRGLVPTKKFWHTQTLTGPFWNKEQKQLDIIHNSIEYSANSLEVLQDLLKDSGPTDPCELDYRVPLQIPDYNTLPERFQDFLLYMRCRTYPMLINQPRICEEKPFLLLAIKSLVPHFDRRQAIRETWGQAGVFANQTVVVVFLLGTALPADNFPSLQEMLKYEAKLHGDLLQWDFRDTFFNLTVKEVLFLDWFSKHCPHAMYVLKGDDDVFVNTLRIINFLDGILESDARDFFIGDIISNAGPHRDQRLKYYIPQSVFEGEYPPYAGGGGYLLSGGLVLRLHNISQQVVLYPIDDVYTGMCLKKLGLVPRRHVGFKTFDIEKKYRDNPCIHRGLMLVHSRTPQEMLKIWPWIVHPELNCQ